MRTLIITMSLTFALAVGALLVTGRKDAGQAAGAPADLPGHGVDVVLCRLAGTVAHGAVPRVVRATRAYQGRSASAGHSRHTPTNVATPTSARKTVRSIRVTPPVRTSGSSSRWW